MKAEIEARIAALEAQLATEHEKLHELTQNIPAEFHNITREIFDKLKSYFE